MTKYRVSLEAVQKAIEMVGGNTQMCIKANVTYQTVIDWKMGKKTPSIASCIKIEQATEGKISRRELIPDFPWDETVSGDKKNEDIKKAFD